MILSDSDLLTIKSKKIRSKLFTHRILPEGTKVCVRLNLNHKIEKNGEIYFIQTIHEGLTPRGKVLGYDHSVTLRNVHFYVNAQAQESIYGGHTKFPMAGVVGELTALCASVAGIEIKFNPKREKNFLRIDTGEIVTYADEATIYNTRVYARGKII